MNFYKKLFHIFLIINFYNCSCLASNGLTTDNAALKRRESFPRPEEINPFSLDDMLENDPLDVEWENSPNNITVPIFTSEKIPDKTSVKVLKTLRDQLPKTSKPIFYSSSNDDDGEFRRNWDDNTTH